MITQESLFNVDIGGQLGRNADKDKNWKILDIRPEADIVHDLSSGKWLPFHDRTVDNIFCSNTLEHIEPIDIDFTLKQFHRVLKYDGRCRIVVPNVAYGIDLYINNPRELRNKKYCDKPKFMPDTDMGYLTSWFYTNIIRANTGHKIGFDLELLTAFCRQAGFKKIEVMEYQKCSPVFDGKDRDRHKGWSIYLELTKEKK